MGDVTEVPARFLTTDGRDHTTKADADAHQRLLDARDSYDRAGRLFEQELAKTEKTADGFPFKLGIYRRYYFIVFGNAGPMLREVEVNTDTRVQMADGRPEVVTYQQDHRSGGPFYRIARYRISDLYWQEHAARRAMAEDQVSFWVGKLQDLPEDVRKALGTTDGERIREAILNVFRNTAFQSEPAPRGLAPGGKAIVDVSESDARTFAVRVLEHLGANDG